MSKRPTIILVPVDGSNSAGAAAIHAAVLAEAFSVPMRLLFAFPADALEMYGIPSETMAGEQMETYSPARFAALRNQRVRQVFDHTRNTVGATGVTIEECVLNGDPAIAILSHAAGMEAPFIVIGNRGLSQFSEMLVGSVSQRVLHHAKCPVTLVHGYHGDLASQGPSDPATRDPPQGHPSISS